MSVSDITKGQGRNMTQLPIRRLSAQTLTAALVAVTLAACGSSSSTSSTSAAAPAASSGSGTSAGGSASGSRATLVACLKAHGVTLPNRPAGTNRPPAGSGGQSGFFGGGGGGSGRRFANNPKLRAAFQACGGGRGFGTGRRTFSHVAVTKFVACVNQHGYSLPAPNYSGKGPIFPASIAKNAKFQTAARACQADLRPTGAPGPGGSPGAGSGTTSGA
jgi:hypothetical protein